MSTLPGASIPTITVTPGRAAEAYGKVANGSGGAGTSAATDQFGAALQRAAQGVIDTGHAADAQASAALGGQGNLTEMVTAVTRAELALQSTVAIRDRVVQAYQDIMKMPI